MSWPLIFLVIVGGIVAIFWTLHLAWRLHGVWRIRRAGPRPQLATRHRIWHDVHTEEANDLRFGLGGEAYVPQPPFEFVEEVLTGSHPSVAVRDARRRLQRMKWGAEAKPEAFCVRFAAACGFEAQTPAFVAAVHDNVVDFGYQGQRSEIGRAIPVPHVQWFHRKARRITEAALRTGLLASGATLEEAAQFARALMTRIGALGRVR